MTKQLQALPYARVNPPFCPDCGGAMMRVTRDSEKAHHAAPVVWTCGPCKASWSVPTATLADAVSVPFDNGTR